MNALTWYEVGVPERLREFGDGDLTYTAWDAFNLIDFGLLAVGLIAIGLGVTAAVGWERAFHWASTLTAMAGAGALLVLVYRTSEPAELTVGGSVIREERGVEITPEIGLFLGLLSTAAILVGGLLAMREPRSVPYY